MLKFASPLLRSRAKDILKVSLTRANLSTSRNCYPNFNVSSTVQDFRSTWSHLPAGTRKNDSEGDIVQRTINSDPQPNGQHTADEKSKVHQAQEIASKYKLVYYCKTWWLCVWAELTADDRACRGQHVQHN